MSKDSPEAVLVSDRGSHLQADFSDGVIESFADVDMLIERLYELGVRPEKVTSVDWHTDIDRALSSGTKIALFHGLRKKYEEAEALGDRSLGEYITSPHFMEVAEKGVNEARAELQAHGIKPVSAPLPNAQLRRRREAIDAATGSVGLSGFKLSPEYLAECERYVRGEIELKDLKAFIDQRA